MKICIGKISLIINCFNALSKDQLLDSYDLFYNDKKGLYIYYSNTFGIRCKFYLSDQALTSFFMEENYYINCQYRYYDPKDIIQFRFHFIKNSESYNNNDVYYFNDNKNNKFISAFTTIQFEYRIIAMQIYGFGLELSIAINQAIKNLQFATPSQYQIAIYNRNKLSSRNVTIINSDSDFPENPKDGQLCIKRVMYKNKGDITTRIYVALDGKFVPVSSKYNTEKYNINRQEISYSDFITTYLE